MNASDLAEKVKRLPPNNAQIPDMVARAERLLHVHVPPARLKAIRQALLPSFISQRMSGGTSKEEKLHQIASLDGLRGLACLFVFNEHYTYNFDQSFLYGWNVERRKTMTQLPFIHILWSGFAMVAVFFVISGYVLSYKPLRQIRNHSPQFHDTMVSSLFRRGFRLFLPCLASVIICAVATRVGLFEPARSVWGMAYTGISLHEGPPPILPGLFSQLYNAMLGFCRMLYIWEWSYSSTPGDYDPHLWTIPVEYRCSMILFLVLILTSRLHEHTRLATVALIIFQSFMTDRKDLNLFMAGMFLAEIDMIRKEGRPLIPAKINRFPPRFPPFTARVFWMASFLMGLYLMSAPALSSEFSPGYAMLTGLVPSTVGDKGWALRSIGAMLTTWAVANSEDLKPIFTNSVSQYLGKISFSLYLVHGNILKLVLHPIMPGLWYVMGGLEGSTRSWVNGWLLGMAIVLPVTIWVADIFWRFVDIPSVKIARWIENRLFAPRPHEANIC